MQLAELLVEAKLTEGDFQRASKPRLELYRDFTRVFDPRQLPQISGFYISYQLIRNVLAAYARGCSFCTLLDARRPDLVEAWYATIGCVRLVDLRTRCKILTWQELSWTLPNALRSFLAVKYGIASSQNSHWTPGG
jgi:hypothetical protein